MDERKNKMTDERYREILPVAYMTAAIVKGRQPRPVEVGLCARAIVDAEDENNLAYRVAMATSCRGVGHSSVRERLKIHDCQVGKNQIICLRFANLRKVGRRHPTFLSPSASSGRHRLPGQKIGAAAPLFPVREGSRTATIAVLTDQGRSSSCKM